MNNDVVVWGLFLLALLAANAPFISNRLLCVISLKEGAAKSIWIRLAELTGLYFIVGMIGLALEYRTNGQLHVQDWEFYAVTLFLFLVLAMPGFIYRHTFLR
jgi:hypothetical protein